MFDVVVLGGGPAGVTAALRARELGATVALVDATRLGGTCSNDGCVPTRVLAKAARLVREATQFADYGLTPCQPEVSFKAAIERTRQIVDEVHDKKQLITHLRTVGVEAYDNTGPARFVDPHAIETPSGLRVEGRHFIIAVGGKARSLTFPGAEHAVSHTDIWQMETLPKSVAIIGGGATGCQLASIFKAFGSDVTLMDIAPRVLLAEDHAVSRAMAQQFDQNGIAVKTGIDGLNRIEKVDDQLHLHYSDDGKAYCQTVEAVLLAVGWPGNVADLNLEAAGVHVTERGYIQVDDYMQTTAPHIYAAGDITGKMMLVQSAGSQARVAVENILSFNRMAAVHRVVPHGGFTDPEYGGVGLTEAQAAKTHDYVAATVPFADLDRAVIDGHPNGFCKLIVDRGTQRIIGAHVVGEQAVELVSMVAVGMESGVTVTQLANMEFAYPTFAGVIGLAARQIVREMGIVWVAPEWRELAEIRDAEWERLDL